MHSSITPSGYSGAGMLLLPFFSLGASVGFTVNAPEHVPSVAVGAGENLSLCRFITPHGLQGLTLSVGPSIGSPVTISDTIGNVCGSPQTSPVP